MIKRALANQSTVCWLATLAYLSILVDPGLRTVDLGQREHLFVLLLVAYLVWRFSQSRLSAWVYLLLGYLGFVMMIKPHFVAVVALTELFFIRERRYRVAVWVTLLIGGVAPFALLTLHSIDALVGFFERVIPYHLSGSYDYYGRSFEQFVASGHNAYLLGMAAVLSGVIIAANWRGVLAGRNAAASIALSIALYASVIHQGKFYPCAHGTSAFE